VGWGERGKGGGKGEEGKKGKEEVEGRERERGRNADGGRGGKRRKWDSFSRSFFFWLTVCEHYQRKGFSSSPGQEGLKALAAEISKKKNRRGEKPARTAGYLR